MPGILIASDKQYHETLRAFFAAGQPAQCCANAGEARRAMCGGSFETLVINAPLPDEFGRELAVQAADNGMDSPVLRRINLPPGWKNTGYLCWQSLFPASRLHLHCG